MGRRVIAIAILLAAGYINPARGQAPATTLLVELENVVEYQVDSSDLSKWGTNPGIIPGNIAKGMGVGCVGVPVVAYGDIVSVNGQPARGTYVSRGVSVCMNPAPTAGVNAIADSENCEVSAIAWNYRTRNSPTQHEEKDFRPWKAGARRWRI